MSRIGVAQQQRQGRRVLLLIAGIPIATMLAATGLWWITDAGYLNAVDRLGTANHGDLVTPPRSVSDMVFRHEGGAAVVWRDLPVKWRLVVVLPPLAVFNKFSLVPAEDPAVDPVDS